MSSASEKYAAAEEAVLEAIAKLAPVAANAPSADGVKGKAAVLDALGATLEVLQKRTGPNEWTDD